MNFIKDIIYINKNTIKKSFEMFQKNWTIIFTGLIYLGITIIATLLLSPFFSVPVLNIVAGVLQYILYVAMLSSYLYILYNIIKYKKFNFKDFKLGYRVYLSSLIRIFFIGWIAEMIFIRGIVPMIAASSGGALDSGAIVVIINLLVLVVINPLPEVIYQKHYSGLDAIKYTFEYMKENWIEWLVPNIILLGLIYIVTGSIITNLFNTNIGLNLNIMSLKEIAIYFIGQAIFSFTMIYRGVLFELLSTSTRRKRMFMRNTYK